MKTFGNFNNRGRAIGELNKLRNHNIEFCGEKYFVNIKRIFFILLSILHVTQNAFSQDIYINGRNGGLFSINKVNLTNQTNVVIHNIYNPWGLADIVLDKAENIYATSFNQLLKILPTVPPKPYPNFPSYDTLATLPNTAFIGCLAIDCHEVIYLGDNTNYIIYTYNLKTGEVKNLGFYNAFFCDFEFYNGFLYAHAIENRNFTGKNHLMRIHLDNLSIMDTVMEISNNPAVDGSVYAMVSDNDSCGSKNMFAPRDNQYIKYDIENKTYDVILFPNFDAAGAGSTTSWIGSYAPLELDSFKIKSDWNNCKNPYSINLFKKRGCCIRPGIEYSLDGITFQSDSTFSDLAPGRYVVHMKDSLGCYKKSDTIVLKERAVVNLSSNKTSCGLNNGDIIIKQPYPGINYTISIDGSPFSSLDSIPGLSSGTHQVIVEYDSGCRDTSIVMIDAEPLPDFSHSQIIQDDYCDKSDGIAHIVSSDLNNGIYYSLDGINYVKDSINLNNLIGGNYPIYLRHETGCLDTISFVIKSFPPSQINSINITPANCNFTDGIIAINSSQMNDEIKLNGIISSTGIFDQLPQGNYTIEIKNNYGCITDSMVFVPGKNVPVIENITAEDAHCNENTGSIFVQSSQSTDQYSLDGINYQSINSFDSLTNGKYEIYIRNIEGCIEKRNAEIIQTGLPLIDSLVTTDESCDQHNGSVIIYTSGNEVINYSLNNSINSNNSTFDDLKGGIYTITIMDAYGCEQFAYFTLQNTGAIKEIFSIEIKRGDCTNALAQVFLPNNTPDKYSITGQTSNPDGSYSLTPGKYTVHIENEICTKDTTITVLPANCEPFVPNVFSPNDDGVNDVFRIEGNSFDIIDFRVFNRWGGLLFSAHNNNGWDGRYKGKYVEPAVYTYFIEVKIGGEKRVLKGDVTVIR